MKKKADISILDLPLGSILSSYPLVESYFLESGIEVDYSDTALLRDKLKVIAGERNIPIESLTDSLIYRINELAWLIDNSKQLLSLDIIAGSDKSGNPEPVDLITLRPGDLLAIVGPTGSGKSRLLADIEWLATGDTPSRRTILVDGNRSEQKQFLSGGQRLIAQLSQTMSFVLDSTVEELIQLHAESRGMDQSIIAATLAAANDLSGESFTGTTALANLSGGQTRALMVADTALVCKSPIVLIDEIENAGIDRKKAFDLLLSNEKIVLLATHDPLLALLAPRRLCMRHGAMTSLHTRTSHEETVLLELEKLDTTFMAIRTQLRNGIALSLDIMNQT